MSTIAGRRVTNLELHIPPAGGARGSGHLDSGAPLALGRATLTIGDLEVPVTVLDSRLDAPDQPMFDVEAGAGWDTLLPTPGASYTSPTQLRLSNVLRDLADIAGEPYSAPPEAMLGTSYGWDSSAQRPVRARHVLDDLVARQVIPTWRVHLGRAGDPRLGQTCFDAWPSLPAADAHGVIESRDLAAGARDVALRGQVAAWLPGATVQGQRIERVMLRETENGLRARVWVDESPLAKLRSIVLGLFPWLGRVGLSPAGALQLRGAIARTLIEGGGRAAAGQGHLAVRLYLDTVSGLLYASASTEAPYSWSAVASGAIPPTPAEVGTPIYIAEGSGKVEIDG